MRFRKTIRLHSFHGFTIIELLVVIGIIGILTALLIPAVQMARESARRTACENNLKQHGIAVNLHIGTHKIFPTGGWGPDWVGDPDRGYGPKQPGGWIFNTLPFLEADNVRTLGSGFPSNQKGGALAKMMATPLEVFHCPSRRTAISYPYQGPPQLQNTIPPSEVAKSDYIINSLLSSLKSEVISAEIQLASGLSKTVLAGEKSLSSDAYETGQGSGDQLSMYMGHCSDISRTVSGTATSDRSGGGSGFGSAHPSGCNVVQCDGAVRFIAEGEDFSLK